MTVEFIVDNNTPIETLSAFVKSYKRIIPIETYKKTEPIKAFQVKIDFTVKTPKVTQYGDAGDYLIQEINGEKRHVKKEIFENNYEVLK